MTKLIRRRRHPPTSRPPGRGGRVRCSRARLPGGLLPGGLLPGALLPSALLGALAAALLVAGCGDDGGGGEVPAEPLVAFDTTQVRIETDADTIAMTVEMAETEAQRSYGLMERDSLPADRGMLFLYPEPQDSSRGFWMYRTLIPLDIAFLDGDGRIVAIRTMQPCTSPNPRTCRIYSPGVSFRGGLEANAGWFAEHGVEVGDRVAWAGAG
ncbi:MAG: DUF192 domain-containing protein [Longimicrobiales bacterium]